MVAIGTPAAEWAPSRRQLVVASVSPAIMVAVGYIDPGNWGTDIAAGSEYGYQLLWVLIASNAVAVFLQYLSAKLGIATGSHLAAVCARRLGRVPRQVLSTVAVLSLIATDLAEFLGVVIGLRILLGGSLLLDIALGAAIVLGLLLLGRRDNRAVELAVVGMVGVVGVVYLLELWIAKPGGGVVGGLAPTVPYGALPVAIGVVGATVMPHNLFLHSGVIHWRQAGADPRSRLRRVTVGSVVALTLALLINMAILVVTATSTASGAAAPQELAAAAHALRPVLGQLAVGAFGLALLAAGIGATITSGVAGDFVLDGLTALRLTPFQRRALAVVPSSIALVAGVGEIATLVASQIVLSVVLPLVAYVLVRLTSDRGVMVDLVNRRVTRLCGYGVVGVLGAANVLLVITMA